jgi:hypothetical protein
MNKLSRLIALLVVVAATLAPAAGARASAPKILVHVKIRGSLTLETPGSILFSPASVSLGTIVTFRIVNQDSDAHVFYINGRFTKFIPPDGGRGELANVKFTKRGNYTASCPDVERGIGGTFRVR